MEYSLGERGDLIVVVNPPNKQIVLRDMYCSTITKGTYNWPNVDLLVISGVLRDYFSVRLIDANTLGLSKDETIQRIVSLNPKGLVFGFGVSVKDEDYYFIKKLREKLPDIKFCGTGGPLYHQAEHELEHHPEFDACLRNFTTNDILKYFKNEYDDLYNITYRENGKIIQKPLNYGSSHYRYPVPHHDQLPLKKYRLSHGKAYPLTSVLTSWGCPSKCNFCVQEAIDYRFRSVDNVIEELDALKNLGVKEIFFRDNDFYVSKKQCDNLMNRMIERRYGFSWVVNIRADHITEEAAHLMKQAGCHALHIGVETANAAILESTVKRITHEKIRNAFRICRENGIVTLGYFILGLPGETVKDLKDTINLALALDCDYASFNMPYPVIGTSLRAEAIEKGWINPQKAESAYDGSMETLIETDKLVPKEVLKLRNLAFRKFYFRPKFIFKALKRFRNMYQVRMMLSEFICFVRKELA